MKRLLVVTLWLLSLQVVAADDYGDLVVEKYISAYDGDTFRVDVAEIHPLIGRNMPIRLRGVETPEIRGKCDQEKALAIKARDFVRELLANAETIVLKNIDRGKYFRIVADVSVDGVDLGSTLIENGLGRLYDGGKKESWCARQPAPTQLPSRFDMRPGQ